MRSPEELRKAIIDWIRPRTLADALQIIGAIVATAWFVFTTDFGAWRPILPLLTLAFFCFALWAISLVRQLLYGQSATQSVASPTPPLASQQPAVLRQSPRDSGAVDFWLLGNWEPGIRLNNTLGRDEKGREIVGEEIHLKVVAKRRMADVRFEISVQQAVAHQINTLARIGSDQFVGVVPSGVEQTFVILRRTFSMVDATYPVLDRENTVSSVPVRVERTSALFPENRSGFQGVHGETYSIHVAVHHDDGPPDKASFNVTLEARKVQPFSTLWGKVNIDTLPN